MRTVRFVAAALFAFAALQAHDSWADTNVSGTLSTNVTWTVANSPYVVTGSVTVATGATLTIEPSVVVRVADAQSIDVNGKLLAVGTADQPILFTSTQATPVAGAWRDINFYSTSDPTSRLSYATIQYVGNYWGGGLRVVSSSPQIDHVTITGSSASGVIIDGSTAHPTFTNCTITGNSNYGVYLSNSGTLDIRDSAITNNTNYAISAGPGTPLVGLIGLTVTGNGGGTKNSIGYRGGTIGGSETWRASGGTLPWDILSSVSVSPTRILTIEPSVLVRVADGQSIDVNGKLLAVGTADQPILFTSTQATPSAGAWRDINFYSGSDPTSRIAYATIRYVGNFWNAGLRAVNASPQIDHVTISDSSASGVIIDGSTAHPTFASCTITGNSNYGVYLSNGGTLDIRDSAITNNTNYAISAWPGTPLVGLTGLTVTGNGGGAKNSIGYGGGAIATSETWRASGGTLPWDILGSVSVNSGATLTIEPSVVIRVADAQSIDVNGKLLAVGTVEQPILFASTRATPVAGAWRDINFYSTSDPTSRLSYATIQYVGNYWGGGLRIVSSSPQIDHVTITGSSASGVIIDGSTAHPTFTNCTITGNSNYGVYLSNGGTLDIRDSAITNNTNYAISAWPGTPLVGLTGLTVTGNGGGTKNSIGYGGGAIATPETWRASGGALPWDILNTTTVNVGIPLTIEPGALVRVADGISIDVNGKLTAVGTASQPILFTTMRATPVAKAWRDINFYATSDPASRLAYATIQYTGNYWGAGVRVVSSSPQFDHVTVSNSSGCAVIVDGGAARPTFANCAFLTNAGGLATLNGSAPDARLCYWGAANGPSGAGFGTGQSVSAAAAFEPWLMASPTVPHYFSSSVVTNRTFNPGLPSTSALSFATSATGTWTATVYDASHAAVRTFSGSGMTGSFVWNGTNGSGVVQANGTYTYEVNGSSAANEAAAVMTGRIIIDSSKALTIAASEAPSFFSPNGDGVQDAAVLTGTASYDDTAWTITVRKADGTAVRVVSLVGSAVSFPWDGKNDGGTLQEDGLYTFDISATLGASTLPASASATLDATPPVAAMTAPAIILSDVYENGVFDFPVIGTASDANLTSWTLDFGSGASPSSWTVIQTSTSPATDATLATWATAQLTNGLYTLRLRVTDRAGTTTTATRQPNLANFKVTQPVYEFNATSGGTVTYTSIVPFTVNETLVLKNETGQVVRTLFSGSRNAGNYTDTWNGRNDAGALLPDGAYFVVGTATAGTSTGTFDLTSRYLTGWEAYYPSLTAPFDPYNRQPLSIQYHFNQPGRVTVVFTNKIEAVPCGPYDYCFKRDEYQSSGWTTLYWNGTDDTGRFRPDLNKVSITSFRTNFSQNAVVLFGSKATVSNLAAAPVIFGPAGGTQIISFDMATYQSSASTVQITFMNVSSNSILRTITLTNQPAGHVTVSWDGKADNGMWVAAGDYAVTATATDALGNRATAQIPVVVNY